MPGLSDFSAVESIQQAFAEVRADFMVRENLGDRNKSSLNLAQRVVSGQLETTKFQHYFSGLEVVGSMAIHHRGPAGTDIANGVQKFSLDVRPAMTADQAALLAKSVGGDRTLLGVPQLKIFPDEVQGSAHLIYWVELASSPKDGGRDVLIDANSGKIIANLSKDYDLAPIEVFSAANQGFTVVPVADEADPTKMKACQIKDLATGAESEIDADACNEKAEQACQVVLQGSPILINSDHCKQTVTRSVAGGAIDAASATALANSLAVLKYYQDTHKRNSYDGRGGTIINIVSAGDGYSNAHWDSQANHMVYGAGDGTDFNDFTAALDVAGHEMTHGVTSQTARLIYMGESGALNEAFSDFFGKMVDFSDDWSIGKKLFKDQTNARGVRDLATPANLTFRRRDADGNDLGRFPYPSHYKDALPNEDECGQTNDNCWVHINSTIPGHMGYRMVQTIGKQKAEKLWYAVLTHGLGPRDNFKAASASFQKLCKQVLDADSCVKVKATLAEVGL